MNRRLSSHRVLFPVTAVALLAIAACSSGSGTGNVVDNVSGDDSGSGSSSGSSSGSNSGSSSGDVSGSSSGGLDDSGVAPTDAHLVIEASADGGCPSQPQTVTGVHIRFNVTWPASTASDQGTGPVDIWLKSTLKGDTMLMGTAQTCGLVLPDINLNLTGAASVCAPLKTCPTKVKIQILNSTWDKITRTFKTTGNQTGWNPGAMLGTAPAVGAIGLSDSAWGSDATAWPPICNSNCAGGANAGSFPKGDVTDDDNDGKPGITANPQSDSNYTLPPTTVMAFAVPPLADEIYLGSRTEIAIDAVRKTNCTDASGTAKIMLFDNHVVGCHIAGGATCDSAAVSFLDQNRTLYGPDASNRASKANPISGTATLKELPATATCADVRAIQ